MIVMMINIMMMKLMKPNHCITAYTIFFMQTLTSPAFSPYNGFEPVAFAHANTVWAKTVRGTCIDTSANWFFYMRVHFLHKVFKINPNPTREAHHPDKCLLLETSHNTHGHIRSARITVFDHVMEWGYRAHTSHTVISELTPNSQWSRLPG